VAKSGENQLKTSLLTETTQWEVIMKKWIYLLAIIGTVGAYTASQSASNEESIKARKKLMKSNGKALTAIKSPPFLRV